MNKATVTNLPGHQFGHLELPNGVLVLRNGFPVLEPVEPVVLGSRNGAVVAENEHSPDRVFSA